ncbi:MAG: lamin tail domain-containing protein [Acidobacteria bacterium]|nr:lamin tail domain-containing protein [Acidobacteriota bacterium]
MLRKIFLCLLLCSLLFARGSHQAAMQTVPLRRITNTAEDKISLNPSLSGDGEHLVFESNADLNNTGGTSSFRAFQASLNSEPVIFEQLGLTRAVAPAVSQDGASIAFASKDNPLGTNADGNSEIFLYAAGTLRQITNTLPAEPSLRHVHGNFQPSMTDDGSLIAFSSNRELTGQNADANLEIFIFDTYTNSFTQLTNTSGVAGATDAKISGDGSSLTFIRDTGATVSTARDLMLEDLSTHETRALASQVNGLRVTYGRAISDDGTRVVYSVETAANTTQVFLYDGRNNLTRQLTSLGARADDVPLHPAISGDGKRVSFATRRNVAGGNSDNSVELYTYDLPTASFARVTNAPSSATAEVVSSLNDDGSLVAFNFPRVLSGAVSSSSLANNSEIYVAATEERPPFFTNLTILNGASYGHEPSTFEAVAPDSIAVANGSVLAFTTMQAAPLTNGTFPTQLAGTSVTVNNLPAQIFSVSPTRVVFHVPPETATTFAQIVVTNSEGFQTRGTIRVLQAAPGIFTATGDGLGAGVIVDAETGQPSPFDPTNSARTLIAYATGARGLPQQIVVNIAGRRVPFESIEASNETPGLDLIRVILPRDLRGAGAVSMSLRAGRRESNPVTLTILGDPARDVFINEALADPPYGIAGDANHDGVRDGADDEFVELVNAQDDEVNISGWTVRTHSVTSTNETTRHVFASGTIIPAHDALVIFGGGTFNPSHPIFGGAQILAASTGNLSLTNTGLTIVIRDSAGHLITQFSYGGSTGLDGNADQSLTRSPDIFGGYILHTQAAGAGGRAYSPGTLADGEFFLPRLGHLTSLSLSPLSNTCVAGQRAQFKARAFDEFNRPLRNARIAFTSSNANIASIESLRVDRRTGIATATLLCLAAGATEVRANASDGYAFLTSAPALLTVTPAPPVIARIEIAPNASLINRGGTQQFSATAFDANNQVVPGVAFTWGSSNALIATVDANGLAHGVGIGNANISATAANGTGGSISGAANVSVQIPLVINEALADVPPDNPATPAIEGDANRDGVRSSGDDEFIELFNNSNQPVDISGVVIADSTSNRYTFPSNTFLPSGRAAIIFGGGSAPANDPAFGGSAIFTAGSLGLNDTGDTIQIKLPQAGADVIIASLAYGATTPIPAPSNQSLTRSPDAEVNQTGGDFVAHLNATEASGRVFSPGTRAGGTPFGSPTLTRIELAPSSAAINIGESQSFIAHAFINDGGVEAELQSVSFIWDSSDESKAVLAPLTGRNATATALAAGNVIVRARAGNLEATATLVINPPPPVLTRIEVTPTAAAVIVGGTKQFTARAFDQNNMEIPGVVFSWSSSNQSVATINQSGLATGIGNGMTEIRATVNQVMSDAAILSVTVPQVPSAGQLLINEALVSFTAAMPVRTDFVELYNTTPQTLDISGLSISFRASGNVSTVSTVTLPGSVGSSTTLLSPNSYFLIANGASTFGVAADFDASATGFDINNSSGAVKIELNGIKLDGLRYQQNGSAMPPAAFDNFGEGTLFTFAGGTPNDLIRSPNAVDTDNNAADFRRNNSHAAVSPKAANPTLP